MKVGPSSRTHTPPHSYLLPAERGQGGVGVGAGGAAGGRGPLHPRHHGGGGHPHTHPPRPLQPHPDTDPLPHRRGAQYDTLSISTVSIQYLLNYTLLQAWRLRAGWAPWQWPPPCWRMGAGAGPVGGTATAPRPGRDTRVCRIYVIQCQMTEMS